MVDRISNIPDEILCHILSFLKTKQAVATSILSKRWEFLWTYVDTLDIEETLRSRWKLEEQVTRAMHGHRGPIKRMRLVCNGRECNKYHYVRWVQTAVSKEVQTLHLCFGAYNLKWRPLWLFHIQTLVELKLECADITSISIPTAPFFPKLKKLHLYRPYCEKDSVDRFISGCSILEYFSLDCADNDIHICNGYREACYISSATLKEVRFNCCISYSDSLKIVLNTPALEVLKFQNTKNSELVIESSMPYLQKAEISVDNSYSHSSLECLEFLSNVSKLCCKVQDRFLPRRMKKPDLHARFNNLTRLEIVGHQFGLDILRVFIENSNNLKAITLQKTNVAKKSAIIWEDPQHVPKCLLSSLQSVNIYEYTEEEEEVDLMIKYILGNTKVLRRLELRGHIGLHVLQKISMFPKASKICEISIN